MVMAIVFDEAKAKRVRFKGDGTKTTGDVTQTPFFGRRDRPDLPLASLNEQDPGNFTRTHFHVVDQFQVIIDGKSRLGKV